MARQRSGVRGVSRLRRTLRRVDPAATDELRRFVQEGAEAITADAINFAPYRDGELRRSIEYSLGRDGLTAIIGPAARTVARVGGRSSATAPFATGSSKVRNLSAAKKDELLQFFKGYWVEYGTKGAPGRNIPPQPARPFMGPAFDVNRNWFRNRVRRGIARALEIAARG